MTTSQTALRSEEYSKMIAMLVRTLSLDDVSVLAKFLGIDANKTQIRSSVDFLVYLMESRSMSEDNVDILLNALSKCQLMDAITVVQNYIQVTHLHTKLNLNKATSAGHGTATCPVHNNTYELYCNTCFKQLCFQCYFEKHRGEKHRVLTTQEVATEIIKSRGELENMSKLLTEKVENTTKAWVALKENMVDPKVYKMELEHTFKCWEQQTNDHMEKIMSNVDEEIEKNRGYLDRLKEQKRIHLQEVKGVRDKYSQYDLKDKNNLLTIAQLFKWKTSVMKIKEKIREEKKATAKCNVAHASFLPLTTNDKIIDFHFGTTVGAIAISKTVYAVVRDERHFRGGVTLSWKSAESKELLSSHKIKDLTGLQPIVIPNSLLASSSEFPKLFLACGSHLMTLLIATDKEKFSVVATTEKTLEIPQESSVTAMTIVTSEKGTSGVMFTHSMSTEVIRLDQNLENLGAIDCSPFVISISSITSANGKVAIIDFGRNAAVVVVEEDGDVDQVCKLQVPQSMVPNMRPTYVHKTSAFWNAIWESIEDKKGRQWVHALHLESGDAIAVTQTGQCNVGQEIVSLSCINDDCLLCFSDGEVQHFSSTDTEEAPDISKLLSLPPEEGMQEAVKQLSILWRKLDEELHNV